MAGPRLVLVAHHPLHHLSLQWNPTWEVASMLHRLCEQGKLALLKNVNGGKALAKGGGEVAMAGAAAAVVKLPDSGEVGSAQ